MNIYKHNNYNVLIYCEIFIQCNIIKCRNLSLTYVFCSMQGAMLLRMYSWSHSK